MSRLFPCFVPNLMLYLSVGIRLLGAHPMAYMPLASCTTLWVPLQCTAETWESWTGTVRPNRLIKAKQFWYQTASGQLAAH